MKHHEYPSYEEKTKPKIKIGGRVHRALDAPKTALGKNQNTKNFRTGDFTFDTKINIIVQILYMAGNGPNIRYMLDGIKNASYSDNELINA